MPRTTMINLLKHEVDELDIMLRDVEKEADDIAKRLQERMEAILCKIRHFEQVCLFVFLNVRFTSLDD